MDEPAASAAAGAATEEGAAAGAAGAGAADEETPSKEPSVKVHFKAVGGAPILARTKFNIKSSVTLWGVAENLHKLTKVPAHEPLFVYVNQSFAPALDQTVGSLHACFKTGADELVLHYAIQQTWG